MKATTVSHRPQMLTSIERAKLIGYKGMKRSYTLLIAPRITKITELKYKIKKIGRKNFTVFFSPWAKFFHRIAYPRKPKVILTQSATKYHRTKLTGDNSAVLDHRAQKSCPILYNFSQGQYRHVFLVKTVSNIENWISGLSNTKRYI